MKTCKLDIKTLIKITCQTHKKLQCNFNCEVFMGSELWEVQSDIYVEAIIPPLQCKTKAGF